jgi:2-isopropylmalate synthase
MKSEHQYDLPRRLQIEFSKVIQSKTDSEGGEVSPAEMYTLFIDEYLEGGTPPWGRFRLKSMNQQSIVDKADQLSAVLTDNGVEVSFDATGNGPLDAFCAGLKQLGVSVEVLDYAEHALTAGTDAVAAAYVECAVGDEVLWGVGRDANIVTASLKAIVSAVNRAQR